MTSVLHLAPDCLSKIWIPLQTHLCDGN